MGWDPGSGLSQAAANATYLHPSVVGPTPTGIAATDRANLLAAIAATPAGGRLWLPSSNTWFVTDQAIVVPANISIEGDSITEDYISLTAGGGTNGPGSPPFSGTVIKQVTAATDLLQLTGAAVSVNLRNLGLVFASGLASTGHGVNSAATQTFSTGHDSGTTGFVWDKVYVYNHDGNHYAFRLLNAIEGTTIHLRGYGGGGIWTGTDQSARNYGNIVHVHPYFDVSNAGSADGIAHSAASNGNLNLLTYIRPQINITDAAATQGTQRPWNDKLGAGNPTSISAYSPDLEGSGAGNPPSLATSTQFNGSPFISGQSRWSTSFTAGPSAGGNMLPTNGGVTAIGSGAAGAVTSGGATAMGVNALASATTATQNTAIGADAAKFNTGGGNTAVGFQALAGVTGTSTGTPNDAFGNQALTACTTGSSNAAFATNALDALTTGSNNTGIGNGAGSTLTTGSNDTLVGFGASVNAATNSSATAIGASSKAASSAVAIGKSVQATGAGSVAIGVDSGGAAATTSVANAFVLGTGNHQVIIPGLPAKAFVTGDKYVVCDASGNLHLSSLGPAS